MFDMDGVLFDSMPHHAKAWVRLMKEQGMTVPEILFYEKEGMTGKAIIRELLGEDIDDELCQALYDRKTSYFDEFPPALPMRGALEAVRAANACGATSIVVTGSGQRHLMNRIEDFYPGEFRREWMVCALDGIKGKPSPDPYLAGLTKAGVKASEGIVVENAPLGVRSGKAAGCFVVAVNTGRLDDSSLLAEGADLLFHSMEELALAMREIIFV